MTRGEELEKAAIDAFQAAAPLAGARGCGTIVFMIDERGDRAKGEDIAFATSLPEEVVRRLMAAWGKRRDRPRGQGRH